MPTFGIQYLWVLLLLRLPSVVLSRGKFAIGTEIIKHYYNVKLFLLLTIILLLAFLQNLYIFLEVEEKCLWCSVLYFSHLEQFLWRFLIVKRLCLLAGFTLYKFLKNWFTTNMIGFLVILFLNEQYELIFKYCRIVVGGGLGFSSSTVPLYIAEVSPEFMRLFFLIIKICAQYIHKEMVQKIQIKLNLIVHCNFS